MPSFPHQFSSYNHILALPLKIYYLLNSLTRIKLGVNFEYLLGVIKKYESLCK